MWSVIFAPIDGVFETPYQSSPLDLQTDSFSIVRSKLIRARLSEIEKGRASDLISLADDRERPRQTWVIGVRWDDYSKKELLEIVECLGGHAVATICRMFSEEFEHRTGGIPDLCLWKPDESEIMFVEVKGMNQRPFGLVLFLFAD
jgi:Fanconi-associated nuclease 1